MYDGKRVVWKREDGVVIDWHNELIEHCIIPALDLIANGAYRLEDVRAVLAEDSDPTEDVGAILYVIVGEPWTVIYAGNVAAMDISEDLFDSLITDDCEV